MEEDLNELEGVKVSAPHVTTFGRTDYHNAIIFGVEKSEQPATSMEEIRVRVVFSHPTEKVKRMGLFNKKKNQAHFSQEQMLVSDKIFF